MSVMKTPDYVLLDSIAARLKKAGRLFCDAGRHVEWTDFELASLNIAAAHHELDLVDADLKKLTS